MNVRGAVKREYSSPLRRAHAEGTRAAIIEAATRLFIEQGYGATSIDAIAAAAGVSRATVFASVGTKKALLKTAYDVALVGDDEPVPMPQRPAAIAVRAEPDVRRYLRRYAQLITGIAAGLSPIYEAVRGAASSDPDVREVWATIEEERRRGARNVVGDVLAKGRLRDGLGPDEAADVMWVLNDPSLFHLLVTRSGWSPERYAAWLGDTMSAQLLPPEGDR